MAAVQSHGVEVHFELLGRGFPLVMLPPAGFDGSFWRLAGYIDALDDMVRAYRSIRAASVAAPALPKPAGTGAARSPATSSPSRIT